MSNIGSLKLNRTFLTIDLPFISETRKEIMFVRVELPITLSNVG